MAIVKARNTAFEGGVFVISVCMILRKASFPADFEFREELAAVDGYPEAGGSCIIAPGARILAGPLWKEEGILYADLDLDETIRAGQVTDSVGHYARPEVLGLRLNTAAQKIVTTAERRRRARRGARPSPGDTGPWRRPAPTGASSPGSGCRSRGLPNGSGDPPRCRTRRRRRGARTAGRVVG
jgi:hypothetical protein